MKGKLHDNNPQRNLTAHGVSSVKIVRFYQCCVTFFFFSFIPVFLYCSVCALVLGRNCVSFQHISSGLPALCIEFKRFVVSVTTATVHAVSNFRRICIRFQLGLVCQLFVFRG